MMIFRKLQALNIIQVHGTTAGKIKTVYYLNFHLPQEAKLALQKRPEEHLSQPPVMMV